MQPSTVAKFENSRLENENSLPREQRESGTPSEKLLRLDVPDIITDNAKPLPLYMTSNESLIFGKDAVDTEVKEEERQIEYTGFTIAFKDDSAPTLRLERQESRKNLKAILDVPKSSEDSKREDSDEAIEIFSGACIGGATHIPPNPYSRPEDVWTGLELNVTKKDELKRYVLMTHGLGKWVIGEESMTGAAAEELAVNVSTAELSVKSADSGMLMWKVDTAEVVRDKVKGPYVKLNIDKENAVCLYPMKASAGDLKRFMTPNYGNNTPSGMSMSTVTFSPKAHVMVS